MDTLYHKLHKISEKNKISFHMPGTKGGTALPVKYLKDVFKIDLTELRLTDNLYAPTGIIKQAQNEVAQIYKAKNTFFLINGTSGGIIAAIGYLSSLNKKILIDRNCHVSVINALSLFKIKPFFVMPEYKQSYGHMGCVNAEELEKILLEEKDIGAVFITSPNYYGWTADIKKISKICRNHGIILCVDAAHGAHFPFSEKLPDSPVTLGGDIVLMSVHKTMPAPTQTAVMHISENIDAVKMKNWINMFQTTSPSYIFMAYIHLAVEYMNQNGEKIYDELYENINRIPENINIIKNDAFKDFSRIVINTIPIGRTGYELSDFLYNYYNIEVEMADLYNVVCIAGAGNTKQHFEILSEGCTKFINEFKSSPLKILPPPPYSYYECVPGDILYAEKKKCRLDLSINKIAGEQVCVYPPGVPVVLPGEVITKSAVQYINEVKSAGGTVIGEENGFINIVSL